MPKFGKTSLTRLEQAHPILQELCNRVVEYFDITILCTHRTKPEQDAAFLSRASQKTWPQSKHNTLPSEAVDAAPWPIPDGWGGLTKTAPMARDLEWKSRVKFYEMIAVFRVCWQQMREDFPELADAFEIRFGADWDGDNDYRDQTFDDLPHIELIIKPARSTHT